MRADNKKADSELKNLFSPNSHLINPKSKSSYSNGNAV